MNADFKRGMFLEMNDECIRPRTSLPKNQRYVLFLPVLAGVRPKERAAIREKLKIGKIF